MSLNKSNLPDNLKITFNNKIINKLNRSYFIVWNSGTAAINKEDLNDRKIKILLKENQSFLSASLAVESRDSCRARILSENENQISIDFHFLDVNDGFIIEILHIQEKLEFKIESFIKGVPEGMTATNNIGGLNLHTIIYMVLTIAIFIAIIVIPEKLQTYYNWNLYSPYSSMFIGFLYMMLFVVGKGLPKIPKSLKFDKLQRVRY